MTLHIRHPEADRTARRLAEATFPRLKDRIMAISWRAGAATSVVVAILSGEGDAEAFAELIEADPTRLMSVASVLAATIVIERELGVEGGR